MASNNFNTDAGLSRRDALRGMAAAGVGAVGAKAATGSAEAGAVTGGCVADWPDAMEERIDLSGDEPEESGDIPQSGDLVMYIHGLMSDDIVDSVDMNGANQAAGFQEALAEHDIENPMVVGMWDSWTTWTVAKSRADDAGETLATWLKANHDKYDSIKIFGHSLGTRVTLTALNELDNVTVESVGLLGGAVDPDTICHEYEEGIENNAEKVYGYHSEGDTIVCSIYAARELTSAVGCDGSDCETGWWFWSEDGETPDNYEDVDVSHSVDGHCEYYQPDRITSNNCLDEIVERQF